MHFLGEAEIMEGIKLHHEICVWLTTITLAG